MEKRKRAIEAFNSGLNCSQSVLAVFLDEFETDNDLALSLACGFGGGMGRLQNTCGAVTGAYMVLGLLNYKKQDKSLADKEETYSMVREFNNKFKSLHGTTKCRELLNCDISTEEGRSYVRENNLPEKVCSKCISDAVKIIGELSE